MDVTRSMLDELFGKDRDIPLDDKAKKKQNYDDPDVCKYFLVSFCPHDLFPNTKEDLGVCTKRHDAHFKKQFDNDENRAQHELRYVSDFIILMQSLIDRIDQKIKRSKQKIESQPPQVEVQRPPEIQKKLDQFDEEIKKCLGECEKLGNEGRIEEAETKMQQVDKFKKIKEDFLKTIDPAGLLSQKPMTVCEVCGAQQAAVSEQDRRIVTHLEGKLHTGFQLLRSEVEKLRKRKEDLRTAIAEGRKQEKGGRSSRSRDRKHKHSRSRSNSRHRKDKKHSHKSEKSSKHKRSSRSKSRSRSHKRDKDSKKSHKRH